MKIILIGFMGSGKTVVAKKLASKLAVKCLEMDQEIIQMTGCRNMAEFFAKRGELLLREWEIRLAKEYSTLNDVIISTGGGVILNKINLDYLKQNNGTVIFLDTPFSVIVNRLKSDTTPRPLFKNRKQAEKLFNFRLPLYRQYADYIVNTDHKSVVQIVEIINKII
ncbi:hypothetical protein A3F03_04585 [Candidatus Roizmanbacteria bacterium RIFCSPHIGHO2_12_FULL_41_11]|uniref:Shikimate kinase n=2 Tax=Candidatus Roizmaniibacteriota TaxID=1752723 RepID=A0A1F7JQU1_9BACT|nr:MAG: hypothetical protein A3F03_04585 [Candidatus Roizmanbacteria bacterium RIFCSPHIGHO2_12_FULL_41_11]OGK57987.1 MAG: hypothetical protein A3H86_00100 [Candidatus Roizmanbacteria bacterium RIFCSPLOWO2_02_FULL_41_9]